MLLVRIHLFVLLLVAELQTDVKAAWKYAKKSRRNTVKFQNDAASYGPNVCAIQQVFRTGQKIYPDCIKKRLKKVCGRPTFIRYECCCGYDTLDGEEGCPSVPSLKNVKETLADHGLTEFTKLLTNTELGYNLADQGAYTVFAPIDEAFEKLTQDQRQRVFPWTYNALSLLHYHVTPGWHHSDHMKKGEYVPSLYYGLKPVWVTGSSNKDMRTVNCARLVKSNILATNGVIHLIDQMLSPVDIFGNLTEILFRDSAQFSQFVQVLYSSQMITHLREAGPYTLFAPNNYAFSRLPPHILEKVLRDRETAEALVKHHTAPGLFCSTSYVATSGVKMLDGTKLMFQCKKNGHYLHNSKLVKPDIMAGNGIIHMINKVQLPRTIQTIENLARELQLNKFLQLCYDSGLLDKLNSKREATMFIPSDEAFRDLSKDMQFRIQNDPEVFEEIFDYHSTLGKINTDSFLGDHGIIMNSGNVMKITVHMEGILVDDAAIIGPNNECSNGVIHVVDKVLTPPVKKLKSIIQDAEDLSIFWKGLEYAGLADMLDTMDETFTVFAPTDQAFSKLPEWHFDHIFDDAKRVKMLMQHHLVRRLLIGRSVPLQSILHVTSVQGKQLVFYRQKRTHFIVNKHSDIVDSVMATNGILYKIDRVIDCDECVNKVKTPKNKKDIDKKKEKSISKSKKDPV